jgi:hypothetical protein
MGTTPQYFRRGVQISAADAIDPHTGIIRNGVTMRTSMMARDSAAATHHRVTDVGGGVDPTAGNRPGFRVAASDARLNDEVARARAAYLDYVTNACKQPQPVRDQDTPAGEPGLVDDHDEPPDRRRFDGMTVDQIQRSHQENMRRIYDQIDHELTTAWRRGAGKEDVAPDAPKPSGNDAVPVSDVETAYRLYAEEISQAWKTRR